MPLAPPSSLPMPSPLSSFDKLFSGSLQPPQSDKIMVGPYRLVRTLGRGSHATVKLAQHTSTGQEVAIKIVNKRFLDARALEKLRREISLARRVHHCYIVRQLDVLESAGHVFIVMEYMRGGELFSRISEGGALSEPEARRLFLQLFAAVKHCHDRRIVHRDLKAENILLDEQGNIKVADFGFSTVQTAALLQTYCGSPPYAAPELFCGLAYEGAAVDVWALGVLLYILTTARMPFRGSDLADTRARVCSGRFTVPESLSPELQSLIRRMLSLDPAARASLQLFLDDPWLNADGDVREFIARAANEPAVALAADSEADDAGLFRSVPSPMSSPMPSPTSSPTTSPTDFATRRTRTSLDSNPPGNLVAMRSPAAARHRRSFTVDSARTSLPLTPSAAAQSQRRHSAIALTVPLSSKPSLPPNATGRLPRSFRADVTTPLAPLDILEHIADTAGKLGLECSFPAPYTARIARARQGGDELSFELRVCALILSKSSRGVRASRVRGDSDAAVGLIDRVLAQLKIEQVK